jgi:hypothetical protein
MGAIDMVMNEVRHGTERRFKPERTRRSPLTPTSSRELAG